MSPIVTNTIARWILRYDPVFALYSDLIESAEDGSFEYGLEVGDEITGRGEPWAIALTVFRSEKIKAGIHQLKSSAQCDSYLLEYLEDMEFELNRFAITSSN